MGSSQLTAPLAWPLTSGPGDGPCWALKPLGWGLVPNRYFPALPVSYFPSTEVPFPHSRSPLHHRMCSSVEVLPSHPFAVTVCPGFLTSGTTL